jgi:DNA-directed RNA polymerase specialized sigma24 family protein
MAGAEPVNRLSQIATSWRQLAQLVARQPGQQAAMQLFLDRYGPAALAFLKGLSRSSEVAESLYQDLCVKVLEGKLARVLDARNEGADKGRFRDYLKAVIINLWRDYQRTKKPAGLSQAEEVPEPGPTPEEVLEAEFEECWRKRLLDLAWRDLKEREQKRKKERCVPYFTALRLTVRGVDSAEACSQIAAKSGSPCSPERYWQLVHRAREFFAESIWAHVTQSLDNPTPEQVVEELTDLGLLRYCRSVVDRHLQP